MNQGKKWRPEKKPADFSKEKPQKFLCFGQLNLFSTAPGSSSPATTARRSPAKPTLISKKTRNWLDCQVDSGLALARLTVAGEVEA